MELNDLTRDEKLACIFLVRNMAMADGHVSELEAEEISEIAEQLGEEQYNELLEETHERFGSPEKAETFLKSISREEARNYIYSMVLECSTADGLAPVSNDIFSFAGDLSHQPELKILAWLEDAWGIEIQQ